MSHNIDISVSKLADKGSTLVVFAAKDGAKDSLTLPKLSGDLGALSKTLQDGDFFKGNAKETCFFRGANAAGHSNILFVGLGDQKNITGDGLRVAAAITLAKLKAEKINEATIHGASLTRGQKDSNSALQNFTEGVLLAAYEYTELKSKPKEDKKNKDKSLKITIGLDQAPSAASKKAVEVARIISEGQNLTRRLGDTPGNYMTPSVLAKEAQDAAKGTKMKVTVWDKARIKKERFGGLSFVAQGSSEDPRFIIMEYKGAGASKKPVCLVGKGLTFDCGGISIKPSQGMEEMKYDMCGGAAVIGAMRTIARLALKVNVIGLIPSTENLVGPAASKPGDVYIARNGKSVEVFNTDAEGRLILSDALAYASELKPSAIFDVATLTGAILIALGNHYTGVFTRDAKLTKTIQEAADQAGEKVWFMPIDDFHVEDTKGTHADLCNITNTRLAGSSTAAAFLEQFVAEGIPWAHFDIAGTAWNIHNRFAYHPKKGASGIMVRTFVDLVRQF